MKKVAVVIAIVTLLAIFYQVVTLWISEKYALLMLVPVPFLVVYMAYVILKYGTPSKYTFDERLYEDMEQAEG